MAQQWQAHSIKQNVRTPRTTPEGEQDTCAFAAQGVTVTGKLDAHPLGKGK